MPRPLIKSPKLLDQVVEHLRVKHYSKRTKRAYVHWIRHYIFFQGKRHPRNMGASEVEAFLSMLAMERDIAAATQNQARVVGPCGCIHYNDLYSCAEPGRQRRAESAGASTLKAKGLLY